MLELIGKEVVSCMECRGLFEGKKALKAHAEMGLCLWPQSEYIPAETSAEIDPKLRKMELDVRKLDPKEVLECDLCDLRYTSTFMKSHIIEHHPDSQQFRDIKVKGRNVRYPCEYCMTVLPKSHLLKHLNIVHHKVNYVTCEGCGDAHPSVAQKNRHRKSGACQGPGKSRFKCSLCPNRTPFTTDESLQRHITAGNNHELSGEYQCEMCNGSWAEASGLVDHPCRIMKCLLCHYRKFKS